MLLYKLFSLAEHEACCILQAQNKNMKRAEGLMHNG
jgi:hypothetical protein